MVTPSLTARFLDSTRGRIAELLRRNASTVEDLAAELGVTDNAVRLHLSMLERDGIVRANGVRRGTGAGKPATIYEIAPAAEPGFSHAYLPFLSALLAELGDRLSGRELRAIMRDVGRRLAGDAQPSTASLAARAELASRVLNQLGAITTVEKRSGGAVAIQGCSCPLGVAVAQRREVCTAVQVMLEEIVGADVVEQCDRSERPTCCFQIST
jgi:predicted ArsR family transcriptional regulator